MPLFPRGHPGHGRPRAAPRAACSLRRADPARRPRRRRPRSVPPRDRAADGGDRRARGEPVTRRILLAVDGDSLAHRAYHGLPKHPEGRRRTPGERADRVRELPASRLWDSEQPDAVLVGWDTLETPTYRHEALPAYQSGREFEDAILEQLGRLPTLVERSASSSASRRATRPTTSSRLRPRSGRARCSSRRPTATRSSSSRTA